MILIKATIKYKGYDPEDLGLTSKKRICVSCDKCSRVRYVRKDGYRNLCRLCYLKNRIYLFGKNSIIYGYKHTNKTKQILSNFNKDKILSEKTKEKIGNAQKDKIVLLETKIIQSYIKQGIPRNEWNGFISKQPYCKLWTESFREKIRNQYHNKCFLCNKSEEDNNDRKLSVYHVNYNKSCLCGSLCEFVPLCNRCHAKTNRNRSYWEDLIMNYLYPNKYFIIDL